MSQARSPCSETLILLLSLGSGFGDEVSTSM